ncbi:sugar nucleotide-binding protein [Candidatus Pacearchaeota archaeon]|nr:sugar nucleotide-binding protein [Candidatus Pacearchaeota archaeon]
MRKIFITGGSGMLGKKLVEYLSSGNEVCAPTSRECNILDSNITMEKIKQFNPEIVIHLAAFVDTFGCELDIEKALDINVVGTINVVRACFGIPCKFVYFSSEYIFRGDRGNYTVEDRLDPINIYGKTKSASEYIVSILPNYQIIRAPFIKKTHPEAFVDQYQSRYFLDDTNFLEKIVNNILNNDNKIVHISSERMSLYELYKKKGIDVSPIRMTDEQLKIIPMDASLKDNSI